MKLDVPTCLAGGNFAKIIPAILAAALDAVDPFQIVARNVRLTPESIQIGTLPYGLDGLEKLVVIGAGKGAQRMAAGFCKGAGDRVQSGIVVVKQNESDPTLDIHPIQVTEGSHPIPDERSERAAFALMHAANRLGPRDLAVVLISGGASSLLALPAPGISLRDLMQTTDRLMRSGADIEALNTVRRHLSQIKGGRLAKVISPARTHCLILSDVIGNDPSAIGSGPTAPDPTSFEDALNILEQTGAMEDLPSAVIRHLELGVAGQVPDTPDGNDPVFRQVENEIIGSNAHASQAAVRLIKSLDCNAVLDETTLSGEARQFGRWAAKEIRSMKSNRKDEEKPTCRVLGGETTVTVAGTGRGGRNQELALAAAIELDGVENVALVAFATDGTDGPTPSAGAVITGDTCRRAKDMGLDPMKYLRENNAYPFFDALGDHIRTGPTRTNVADLLLLLVG